MQKKHGGLEEDLRGGGEPDAGRLAGPGYLHRAGQGLLAGEEEDDGYGAAEASPALLLEKEGAGDC